MTDSVFILLTGVCALDQYVYVVGGYDSVNQLASVERYDVETNQWEIIADMGSPRSALGVAVVNNKLYALGKPPSSYIHCSQYQKHWVFFVRISWLGFENGMIGT